MGILVKLVLLLLSINVEARPISYSGGSTAMLITDNMNSLYDVFVKIKEDEQYHANSMNALCNL